MSLIKKLFSRNKQNEIPYVRKDINIFLPIIEKDNMPNRICPLIGYFNSNGDKFHDIITDKNYSYDEATDSIMVKNIKYTHASISDNTLYLEDDVMKSVSLVKDDCEYSLIEAIISDILVKDSAKYKHLYKFDQIENDGLVKKSLIEKMYSDLQLCVYRIYKSVFKEIESEKTANNARAYNLNF